jgi:protein subunit release factor A
MTAANMFNKLEQIETRYEEMNVELAKPDVLADGARYQKLALSTATASGSSSKNTSRKRGRCSTIQR